MDPKTLVKKKAGRIARSPVTIGGLGTSIAASLLTANPLPFIGYALLVGGVFARAATSDMFNASILAEEKASETEAFERREQADKDRKAAALADLEADVMRLLSIPPISEWQGRDELFPDYRAVFGEMRAIGENVRRVVDRRRSFADGLEDGIVEKIEGMLESFLKLTRSRITYLFMLNGIVAPSGLGAPKPASAAKRGRLKSFLIEETETPTRRDDGWPGAEARGAAMTTFEDRVKELERDIARLKRLAEKQPAAAKERRAHVELLEGQIETLRRCDEADQRISAKLDMMPDVFRRIQQRLGVSEFDASEISVFLDGEIKDVDRTVFLSDQLRLDIDEINGGSMRYAALSH